MQVNGIGLDTNLRQSPIVITSMFARFAQSVTHRPHGSWLTIFSCIKPVDRVSNIRVIACFMKTVTDIIDACGGTSAFARLLEVNPSTASEMKRRQSIPVRHWPRLVRKATSDGIIISNDLLVSVHTTDEVKASVTPHEA